MLLVLEVLGSFEFFVAFGGTRFSSCGYSFDGELYAAGFPGAATRLSLSLLCLVAVTLVINRLCISVKQLIDMFALANCNSVLVLLIFTPATKGPPIN